MSLLYSFIAGLLYVLHTHSEALALPDADLTNSVDEAIARLNYTNFQNVDLRILNSALENVSDDDLYLQIFTERKGVELIFKWMNSFNVKKAHKSPVLKEICRATTRLLLLGTRSSNFSERVIKCRLLELMVQLSFERILFGDKNFTTEYFSLASDVIANLVKFEHLLSDIQLVVQKKLVEKLVVVQNRFLSERNHLVKLKLGGILALQDLTVLSREDLEWNFAQDRATVINIRAETIDGVGNRQKYFDSTFHSQTRSSDIFSYFNNLLLSEANRIFLCHDNHTLGLYHQVTSLLNTETSGFVPDTDLGIAALRGLYMMTQGCLRCKEYLRRRGITHSLDKLLANQQLRRDQQLLEEAKLLKTLVSDSYQFCDRDQLRFNYDHHGVKVRCIQATANIEKSDYLKENFLMLLSLIACATTLVALVILLIVVIHRAVAKRKSRSRDFHSVSLLDRFIADRIVKQNFTPSFSRKISSDV